MIDNKIERVGGKWVKYSNRFLPKYVRKHWLVKIKPLTFIAFHNFETATIFNKLLEVEEQTVFLKKSFKKFDVLEETPLAKERKR